MSVQSKKAEYKAFLIENTKVGWGVSGSWVMNYDNVLGLSCRFVQSWRICGCQCSSNRILQQNWTFELLRKGTERKSRENDWCHRVQHWATNNLSISRSRLQSRPRGKEQSSFYIITFIDLVRLHEYTRSKRTEIDEGRKRNGSYEEFHSKTNRNGNQKWKNSQTRIISLQSKNLYLLLVGH